MFGCKYADSENADQMALASLYFKESMLKICRFDFIERTVLWALILESTVFKLISLALPRMDGNELKTVEIR